MNDKLTFQPKDTTKWGHDTVALYRRYNNFFEAVEDRDSLRRHGWFVDSAYPHAYLTGWETHAVIAVTHQTPTRRSCAST